MAGNVRVQITRDAERAVARLQKADALPDFRKRIRAATQPAVPAVRRSIRSIPSSRTRRQANKIEGRSGGSLRQAVANAVTRKIKLSTAKVMVVVTVVPKGNKSNLASVLEGTKPWVHPTYGHKPEVEQESHPEFFRTIEQLEPEITRQIEQVLKDFERKL